jgi:hypothetical protein
LKPPRCCSCCSSSCFDEKRKKISEEIKASMLLHKHAYSQRAYCVLYLSPQQRICCLCSLLHAVAGHPHERVALVTCVCIVYRLHSKQRCQPRSSDQFHAADTTAASHPATCRETTLAKLLTCQHNSV